MDGTKQKIKGKGEEAVGAAREKMGELTGNEEQQVKGRVQKTKGKARSGIADTARKVKKAA